MTKKLVLLFVVFFANVNLADDTIRVFIFAGQSNMVGSDSKLKDVDRFPPFRGLEKPQKDVLFSYVLGRQRKTRSPGWVPLASVNKIVGPELSFARKVKKHIDGPIAIIKCAAGGTHLGGDWNPDDPQGFKMYPLTLEHVRKSLHQLTEMGKKYRIEGFVWHQGENDMFNEDYMKNYGPNLTNFVKSWRRDLKEPELKFYVGELCTKTIWGMDLRPRMYAISQGQKSVAKTDKLVEYIPTAHVGVEIGGGVGLHYHYGTLGQLEHGINYADAYLRTIGVPQPDEPVLDKWPFAKKTKVRLFITAGHRNMEGERAFVQGVETTNASLLRPRTDIPFKFSIGGGYKQGKWGPLRPAGYYSTFGPELSLADTLSRKLNQPFAIAKFTHSGSQMNDWTPEGSMAKDRHIYPKFIEFIKESRKELIAAGFEVELAGILYHIGENEMSMPPYRRQAAKWLMSTIAQSRRDLALPKLQWFVTQQPPTDDKRVNKIDVVADMDKLISADPNTHHLLVTDLPEQEKKLVIDTKGIIHLGRVLAEHYLKSR